MKNEDKKAENMSDVLSGLKDILVTSQDSFLKLLGESERRAEKRQEESESWHEKQKSEMDEALKTLVKSTNELLIAHTETKKDRETQAKESTEIKGDLRDLKKLHYAMSDVVTITAERQNNNTSSIGKGKDHFHKVVTALISAALVYLVTTKGG